MRKNLIVLLSLFILNSCSDYTIENEMDKSPEVSRHTENAVTAIPNLSPTVTSSDAEIIAKRFLSNAVKSRANDVSVREIIKIKDENGADMMYVVNYVDNNGFVIVSSNKEYWPILAFSNEGNFKADCGESGCTLWIKEQSDAISKVSQLPDSVKEEISLLWSTYCYNLKPYSVASPSRAYDSPEVASLIENQLSQWSAEGKICYTLADFKDTE